jgi:signal transduction histidine kinase
MLTLVKDNRMGMKKVTAGLGLGAMNERLEAVQGKLSVTSEPGKGTAVICKIPLKQQPIAESPDVISYSI